MRLIGGRPLVAHTVDVLRRSGLVDRLIVTTDDPEVITWASLRGVEVHQRPKDLASDSATVSDVAAHLVDELDWEGDIGVFQPTSPFRTLESVEKAIQTFRSADVDSLSTAVREPHLYWFDAHGDVSQAKPLFKERLNRQFAHHGVMRETGSIQLVKGKTLRHHRQMVSSRHLLFELGSEESLDIDTPDDLADARRRFQRQRIIFRVRANKAIGSGHLFHCLQLAEELEEHSLVFLLKDCDAFVEEALMDLDFPYQVETDLATDLRSLAGSGRNLVVNDVLDTNEDEVLQEKAAGYLVVNIEDLGPGTKYADWVVNALYPVTNELASHVAWGSRFATLRPEFSNLPEKVIRKEAERILITFGGADPAHLAERCARLLHGRVDAELRVVLGPGAASVDFPEAVSVARNIRSMAVEMMEADVILTSGGRTVYEAAATGTPVIVLAQNAREATHAHLTYDTGALFLGIGRLVDDQAIVNATERLMDDWELRSELSERLRRSIDTHGAERVARGIRSVLGGL